MFLFHLPQITVAYILQQGGALLLAWASGWTNAIYDAKTAMWRHHYGFQHLTNLLNFSLFLCVTKSTICGTQPQSVQTINFFACCIPKRIWYTTFSEKSSCHEMIFVICGTVIHCYENIRWQQWHRQWHAEITNTKLRLSKTLQRNNRRNRVYIS